MPLIPQLLHSRIGQVWPIGMILLLAAGCQSFDRWSPGLPFQSNDPPIVKESEDGELYPNVRFQSPDGGQDAAMPLAGIRDTFNEKTPDDVDRSQIVTDVIIEGNERVPTHQLKREISTRPGRYFDPDRLQQDIDRIWRLPEIRRIEGPYLKQGKDGVQITIRVVERTRLGSVKFIGNRGLTDRQLQKETGLSDGEPLDIHKIRMAKTRIEDLYREKGYPKTQVEIIEGDKAEDRDVVFLIHEDQLQRVWDVEFEGNTFATDARLKNFIKSKPGILKVFGGQVKRDEIEQDILRLSNYYRKFGFFNAQIGREISESNDGRWLTLRFIINEGPRYKVRNVSFVGNRFYRTEKLNGMVNLKSIGEGNPEYNVAKLNEDVVALRDLYGSQGFVFVKVEAEPRFLEEPGLLDIVYKIDEGNQYRVGNINVHIEGDTGVTKRQVAINRLSLQPGDLIDVSKLRADEGRLRASQIFGGGQPGSGPGPRIVVRPPELKDLERTAEMASGDSRSGNLNRY